MESVWVESVCVESVRNPQTVLDSAITAADSANLSVFGGISSGTVF